MDQVAYDTLDRIMAAAEVGDIAEIFAIGFTKSGDVFMYCKPPYSNHMLANLEINLQHIKNQMINVAWAVQQSKGATKN